ncbi:MAG: response regulator [Planctomycetota bacterium]|jgi:DNA-binding response OmpR family regulator
MSAQQKKVLVVDDDQTAVAFVHAALESEKYEVVGAGDGLAGLSQAREELPDLIILDVYMPRQPGFYTLRDLKADPKTKNIPVIMLTSVAKRLGVTFSTQDIYDFLGTEPDVYLEKPVDPMFLRRTTDRLLGMNSSTNGLVTRKEQ